MWIVNVNVSVQKSDLLENFYFQSFKTRDRHKYSVKQMVEQDRQRLNATFTKIYLCQSLKGLLVMVQAYNITSGDNSNQPSPKYCKDHSLQLKRQDTCHTQLRLGNND